MKNLDFYYDFGSPNVYLAWKALSQVEGLTLTLKPALIGGIFKGANNQPPWQAFAGVPAKMQYMMVEIKRFAAMYDVAEFQMNPHFPVNTLLAMRTAMVAHADEVAEIYFQAVQTAMWETGRDVSKPDVLAAVLTEAGLPGEPMVARTQEPEIKQALMDVTQAAIDRGLFGLPTWFDAQDMYFGKDNCWMFGAQPRHLPS
ncbi:2-hydroxychromene-2-carboxylate isomerase [Algimonas arctica]|uniref:2-hydroxychromene-2-carboxylate isomerase n=1 Tax=Algimonas arctica TaxID=1479486 RepID=A0A8J3G1T3_9PROT|nr:2-hydroxychromene-2-carboxylate isomerase [Algimonas arctica]GHA88957.1 2-hydroxychromene-2-carboxylate isomerase [Algimonas arctica]